LYVVEIFSRRNTYTSEKYLHQLNVRLSLVMHDDLEELAKREGVKPSELVRSWIREKLEAARKRPGRPRLEA